MKICIAIDIGLVFGPVPGGFISLVSVDWPAWLTAILFGGMLLPISCPNVKTIELIFFLSGLFRNALLFTRNSL